MKTLLVLLVSGALSGCSTRLPNIKAETIQQTVTFPGVSSSVDASGISVTDSTIRAADATWRLSIFGFTTTTATKGFQQRREKDND